MRQQVIDIASMSENRTSLRREFGRCSVPVDVAQVRPRDEKGRSLVKYPDHLGRPDHLLVPFLRPKPTDRPYPQAGSGVSLHAFRPLLRG